ncbi:nuclear factor NF-kappa-B p105 subunit-like [Anarrhichthys ocellatus]|uniref:nuclear factor NF-kappa-B p105 subunit-like n=1 Tax=Anarrhichthys ocellatus TaxID=433405 RepID=UPI0012ECF8C6|nr:nuclear factor NF-kappa-B p105 subunit-like [Anarrhichthys ocellatus]XP_031732042.1 nuclear factor NF-kappa-B p105 subunit-like [Anarrhichthys ocellatus]
MAGDDHYLHPSNQIFDNIVMDPLWEFPHFPAMHPTSSLRTVDGPFLQIVEQPKQVKLIITRSVSRTITLQNKETISTSSQ